ncbi:hypothetical protein Pcac1_g2129 [Phytophthora cactorum]|nr:hypothetical protein Pcac1_g2129 [Phytophthora cactorum]
MYYCDSVTQITALHALPNNLGESTTRLLGGQSSERFAGELPTVTLRPWQASFCLVSEGTVSRCQLVTPYVYLVPDRCADDSKIDQAPLARSKTRRVCTALLVVSSTESMCAGPFRASCRLRHPTTVLMLDGDCVRRGGAYIGLALVFAISATISPTTVS